MPTLLRATLALAVLTLAATGTAAGGGWATAGISPLPDDSISAGGTWKTTITVLQHGRTPLEGVEPTLTIRNGDETRTFAGTPTGEPGKYAVTVEFPSRGTWDISVWDGFTEYGNPQTTTFGSVDVAGGAASGGGFPLGWTLAGVAAVLAAAALLLLRRRARPDSVAAPLPG